MLESNRDEGFFPGDSAHSRENTQRRENSQSFAHITRRWAAFHAPLSSEGQPEINYVIFFCSACLKLKAVHWNIDRWLVQFTLHVIHWKGALPKFASFSMKHTPLYASQYFSHDKVILLQCEVDIARPKVWLLTSWSTFLLAEKENHSAHVVRLS